MSADLNPAMAKTRPAAQKEVPLALTGIQLSPEGSSLRFDTTRPLTETEGRSISVMKFPSPYRLLVEIPNAQLAGSRTVFPVHRNGIDRVELSDNRSTFYSSARAIVYVDDNQTLTRLQTVFERNGLTLKDPTKPSVAMLTEQPTQAPLPPQALGKAQPLPPVAKPFPSINVHTAQTAQALPLPVPEAPQPVAQQTVLPGPVPADMNIIEAVDFKDGHLILKGHPGSNLRIKNRFSLTAPNRLVLDVDNAVLRSKELMNPMSASSGEIRQIRLGQFDEKTVRIVIEGIAPEQYEAIYSGADHSLLTISPYSSTAITKLSANTRIGQVESIDLKRENGGTILRLAASTPIVHRFTKQDNKVILDLLNESAHPTNIAVDCTKYPEVSRMRLEPLTEGQPNSKLAITLAAPCVVTPSVSADGKVLELSMIPGKDGAGDSISSLLASAGKAPFAARIVLDAGHGGKDIGANRDGVNEKDLNLTLAHMVREALEEKGFKVHMTRSTDVFLPLPEITAITNRVKPDLFISIHHNASVNPSLKGIETYYYTPQSIALAKRVHARQINNVVARDGGVKRAMFYVIHHTNVPAILCEVGYVSNPEERKDLQTYERKLKTARAIADGVVDYLKASVSAKAKP